jgi:hypothetical protein
MRAVDVVREERGLSSAAAARYLRRLLRAHPEVHVTRVATGRGGGKVAWCDDTEAEARLRALCHRIATEVASAGKSPPSRLSAREACVVEGFECTTLETMALGARLAALEALVEEVRVSVRSARLAGSLGGKKILPC